MRTLPPPMTEPTRMSVQEYIAFEEASPFRHEYHDGAAHPMGDTVPVKKSARQGLIKGNLFLALYDSVPCSSLLLTGAATLRTEVAGTDIHRFPDILVIDRGLPNNATVCHDPQFVAEILVREHEQYGTPNAETAYRQFGSLLEFMLIPECA